MLNDVLKEIMPTLIQIAGLILLLGLGWAVKYLKDKIKVTVIHEALNIAKETIFSVITSSIKELKTKYEEFMEDGELSDEELDELKQIIVRKVNKEIPNAVKKLLGLTEDEFKDFIGDYAEEILEEDIKKYLEE